MPDAASKAAVARRMVLVIAAAAALYLVGNRRVALWDRDEPRYAQASRQMLESGDWVVPYVLDQQRTEKPPLIYWCQAVSMALLGDNEFAVRFPSVVAMLLTLTVLGIALFRAVGPVRALLTVFILSTCALAYWSAKTCLVDSVLLFFTTVSQLCLYAIYRGDRSWKVALLMWIAIALGMLTKGPVVLGVLVATTAALGAMDWTMAAPGRAAWPVRAARSLLAGARRAAVFWCTRTRAAIGLAVCVAVAAPWMILAHRRAPGFLSSLYLTFLRHASTSTHQHSGPPGYHLAMVWVFFFPWSFFLPPALIVGWRHRNIPQVRFALATVLGTWVLVEMIQTKLPHYLLPAYSSLSFLCADLLVRCVRRQHQDLAGRMTVVAAGVWALGPLALSVAAWWVCLEFVPLPRAAGYALVALTLVCGTWVVAVYHCFRTHALWRATVAMGVGMMAAVAIFFGVLLPNLPFMRVPSRIAEALHSHGARSVSLVGYGEDSLIYYAYQPGGRILNQYNEYLWATAPADWTPWIVIRSDLWKQTPPQFRALVRIVADVHGLKYASGWQDIDVLVVQKK